MPDAFDSVRLFEKRMANFCNAPFAVAVESCSAALHLCCLYCRVALEDEVVIPRYTYPSVAAAIIHAGGRVGFHMCGPYSSQKWQKEGYYYLNDTLIIDSARCINQDMYKEYAGFYCLSFHARKVLPIGRGGMILTDSKRAAQWFRKMRHDGRHDRVELRDETIRLVGWNYLMTPEQASRGLSLINNLNKVNISEEQEYPDLSKFECFTEANR